MERVTGIGGVFFKAHAPERMAEWYRDHLGIESQDQCATFEWLEKTEPPGQGMTVWSLFPADTEYFKNSNSPFMINYRVKDLDAMIAQLRAKGVAVEGTADYDYGRFAWVTDPEGNRIELWEPSKAKQ